MYKTEFDFLVRWSEMEKNANQIRAPERAMGND